MHTMRNDSSVLLREILLGVLKATGSQGLYHIAGDTITEYPSFGGIFCLKMNELIGPTSLDVHIVFPFFLRTFRIVTRF